MTSIKKIPVLVMVNCDLNTRQKLLEELGDKCKFTFIEKDTRPTSKQLAAAEIIIGEPTLQDLQGTPNLKLLQLTWAGADRYTQTSPQPLSGMGEEFPDHITLANASGAFGTIISEYIIGGIIAIYRAFPAYLKAQAEHVWRPQNSAFTIAGKGALILGTGDIGSCTAQKLKAFGCHVTGIRRSVTDASSHQQPFDEIFSIADLDRCLPLADIVICCLPGTRETTGLMNISRLRAMKSQSLLVNVGRGSLIPTQDLITVLNEGHLLGAVLDVFQEEPLPPSSPLWDIENVLLTPHISGPSFGGNPEVEQLIWDICRDNLHRYTSGAPLTNIVDIHRGY